jgi:TPR repeat protein
MLCDYIGEKNIYKIGIHNKILIHYLEKLKFLLIFLLTYHYSIHSNMSDSKKMQDTEYERVNWITKDVITENSNQTLNKKEFNKASLITNNTKTQEELSQLIRNFNKINTKEIDPIAFSNEREKLLFKEGYNGIVDEINDLIFELNNKGTEWELERQQIIEYLNDNNLNSQEIYYWLLNNQNSSNSIFILGYFNFCGIATSENDAKAFKLFIIASEKNHKLAQFYTGNCYLYGLGTTKNEKLAFEYFVKVANKNLSSGQLNIGYCYKQGKGITKDFKVAFYWYEKAANNGNKMAMYNLGCCYKNGNGVEQDYNKAFELYKQLAEGGYSDGITMLGYCYNNGIGTKIDKQKAFELYQNAANLGDNIAQNNLALMYENGNGITKDISKAIYWYEKSAKQGNQGAQNRLDILQKYQ